MYQVIFKGHDGFYMTSKRNYNAYVQDPAKIKKLEDVNTLDDVWKFIEVAVKWFGYKFDDFSVVYYP